MFVIRQKTKSGRVCVHLASSVHRPGKTPIHNRTHLGVLDPSTGELLLSKKAQEPSHEVIKLLEAKGISYSGRHAPSKGRPRRQRDWHSGNITVEEVGRVGALLQLAGSHGLVDALHSAFGDDARQLLCAAIHQVCEGAPLCLLEGWLENVSGVECDGISPSAIGSLAGILGSPEALEARRRFFSEWIRACGMPKVLVHDTTSISTYSNMLEDAEWGYNRDNESLPQVNLALVMDRGSRVPIWYRSLPGSIPDVASLQVTAAQLMELGLHDFVFTLDRGYFSNANLAALISEGIGFIIGIPLHLKQARALLQKHRRALSSFKRSFLAKDAVVGHFPCAIPVKTDGGARELPAHLYFCKERHNAMSVRLQKTVLGIAAAAGETNFDSYQDAREWLVTNAGKLSGLFRLRIEEGRPVISVKPNRVSATEANFGFTLIATSGDGEIPSNREDVLSEYRSRDLAEKVFDAYKNATGNNRLRTGNGNAAEGRMFIAFLAVTLRAMLENKLKEMRGKKTPSVPEALASLSKIKRIKQPGSPPLMLEVPKKSREVAAAVGVNLENIGDIVAMLAKEQKSTPGYR